MDSSTRAKPSAWRPDRGVGPDERARPVAALALDYPSGHCIPLHHHQKAQLVFASEGVMTVTTCDGNWVVPPQRAVWVPSGTEHEITMSGAVKMRTLYLSDAVGERLPERCCVVAVSPLLHALILRAMQLEPLYAEDGPAGRLVGVLIDEIEATEVAPLHLPVPNEARIRVVVRELLADPADSRTLGEWAQLAGASARTLARLFERETGMGFSAWRAQLRLLRSLELLALGEAVTSVALALGYESPSAFISMFRRNLGSTPGRYFDREPLDHALARPLRREESGESEA